MNVADKAALFSEAYRVLKPGAALSLWEICKGDNPAITYPVPWADTPSFSYLISPSELARILAETGFADPILEDATGEVIQWILDRRRPRKSTRERPPRPDFELVLKGFRIKRTNVSQNIIKGSLRLVRGVFPKA